MNMCIVDGKYRVRRPCNADYEQPMQTDLLWVYEGLIVPGRHAVGVERVRHSPE